MIRRLLPLAVVAAVAISAGGCGLFSVHRVPVQQGNVVTQEMVDQLAPGMTRRQVAFILGEPVLRNDFEPDRWDYVYSLYGRDRELRIRRVSLFFSNDTLSHFAGDLAPGSDVDLPEIEDWDTDLPSELPGVPPPGTGPAPTPGPMPPPGPGPEPGPGPGPRPGGI